MNKILVVVDMQNDFITGSLGTPEAQAIVPKVVEKIKNFDGTIMLTQDTHDKNYLDTQEGKLLPIVHCIRGTDGCNICSEVYDAITQELIDVFEKETFGSERLVKYLQEDFVALQEDDDYEKPISEIELCGVCTDICVVSNALLIKAFLPEVKIVVDSSCCAGVTPERHEAALEVMRSCQIEVI